MVYGEARDSDTVRARSDNEETRGFYIVEAMVTTENRSEGNMKLVVGTQLGQEGVQSDADGDGGDSREIM